MHKVFILIFLLFSLVFQFKGNELYSQNPDFNYREPYFLEINTVDFAKKNNTHRLDDEWGLWGHNLLKLVNQHSHSDDVYALIDNKRNKNQFCFSNPEINKIILKKVIKSSKKKFVIAPQDNSLACLCNKCLQKGNTKNNASPTVFSLLKKLALKKPTIDFYTLAYLSTTKTPNFSLPKNVGVFYSTINFQEGIPYERLRKKEPLLKELNLWKHKTNKIIVWDYALNFDNYHSFYPNIFNIQKNLSLFKELHIEGVFFNGSETYAVLQGLKTSILSKLLNNNTIDLNIEIERYFKENYPKSIATILTPYYLNISHNFSASDVKQGIYSNIISAEKKYLNPDEFISFFENIKEAYQNLKTPSVKTEKLLISLTFLKLELIKTHGINNLPKSSKKDIITLLDNLKQLSLKNNVLYTNERKHKITDYVLEWFHLIFKPSFENLLLHKTIKSTSKLDEDYNNLKMLNDGKYGFLNYDTNWLLISKDDLNLDLNNAPLTGKHQLIFSFLNDPKHQIYFPESIIIYNDEKLLSSKKISTKEELLKKEIKIAFDNNDLTSPLKIHITRRKTGPKSTIACDEIILKSNQ